MEDAPGRRMLPADIAYLLAGTHSFGFAPERGSVAKVFLQVSDRVVAKRLTGEEHDEAGSAEVVRQQLGTNPDLIRSQAALADLRMPGTGDRPRQVSDLVEFCDHFFEPTSAGGAA